MKEQAQSRYFWNIVGSVFIGIFFFSLVIYFLGAEIFYQWEKLPNIFIDTAIISILILKCLSFIGWYLALEDTKESLKYYDLLVYGYAITIAKSILMLDYMVYPNYNVAVLYTLIVPFGWFINTQKGTLAAAFWSAILCIGAYFIINDTGTFSNFFFNRMSSIVVIAMVGVFLKYFKINKLSLAKTNNTLGVKVVEVELKSKELEQYLYTVSHDLKEPLRSLSLILEIFIKNNKSKIIQDDLELLGLVKESTVKMGKSIQGILEYSKLGENFTIEKVNISKLVNDVLFRMDEEIKNKNVSFEIRDLGVLNVYLIDFQLLVEHLISNAVLYSKVGIPCEISISRKDIGDYAMFYFKDNGIGIEKVNHQRIFQIFQSLKGNSERKGIGLAHCSKIAELHQGNISVESELNEGSTFIVKIYKNII